MSYIFWLSVAVVLLIVEMVAPAFFFVFFSFAAFVIAGLAYADLAYELSHQIAIFAAVAVLSLLLLRKKFRASLDAAPGLQNSDTVHLDSNIPARAEGQVTYQGSPWIAINDTDRDMKAGETAVIAGTQGVKLILRQTP